MEISPSQVPWRLYSDDLYLVLLTVRNKFDLCVISYGVAQGTNPAPEVFYGSFSQTAFSYHLFSF